MTKEELAALLNRREYGKEITDAEEAQAKAAGLLVIFGASDDLTELRGAISDEAGAYDGAVHQIDSEGFVPSWESVEHDDEESCAAYFKRKGSGIVVEAKWDWKGYSWWIETAAPHAAFDIMEDPDTYCRGIVLAVSDLTP